MSKVTAIIVNYRTPSLAIQCAEQLLASAIDGIDLSVVVVDGGSGDRSAETLQDWLLMTGPSRVSLLPLAFNGGFGWANNQAIRQALRTASPDYFYLINPDALPNAETLMSLVKCLEGRPNAAVAGSRLLDSAGRVLASAFRFPTARRELQRVASLKLVDKITGTAPLTMATDQICAVDWVTGASCLLRAHALREVGLFDEGFFLYYEEVELMDRLHRAGWACVHVPDSVVTHDGGAATGFGGSPEDGKAPSYWFDSRARYFRLTGGARGHLVADLALGVGTVLRQSRRVVAGQRPIFSELRGAVRCWIGLREFEGNCGTELDRPLGTLPCWTHVS